ncbi:hypothetical protein lerEdw1_018449 [Lerista edwardsae]|nr:hypothetical protein lerEdw1_018449 [Lerista edwardsae]
MDLLPHFSIETWTILLILIGLLTLYGVWPYGVFKKLGIPGPSPLPFFGTILNYRHGFLKFDSECFQKYGKVWGLYDGRQAILAVADSTIIKAVLVKECYSTFTNRRNLGLTGLLENAVSIAQDEQWKRIRTVLSPTFTSGKLKEMFPIIKHYGEILVQNVQKKVDKDEPVVAKDVFGCYSMDVITSTSFGVNIDSMNNPKDPFVKEIQKLTKFRALDPRFAMGVNLFPRDALDFFTRAIKKIKENREKEGQGARVDFLQLMLEAQCSNIAQQSNGMEQPFKGLTDTEILAQAFIFIFAGYEPSSNSLGFMAYLMATHPDVQQKVQDEIDSVFPNKAPLTYDAIMQLEYLDMVLNETQRLYPLGGRLERVCKKDVEINGVTIPKGTVVMIPPFVLHRAPEFWPEPDEFRPERFSKENKESVDPYVYLPFGAGPRNCIGMRFAIVAMKVAIASLLQHFSFRVCKETPVWSLAASSFQETGHPGANSIAILRNDVELPPCVWLQCFYGCLCHLQSFGLRGLLEKAISRAQNEQWKRIRTVLSPTFTSGKLKEMFPIIKHYGEILVQNVQKKVDKDEPVVVKDVFGCYSMDVITSTSFGVNIDSMNNPKDPFVREIQKLTKFRALNPFFVAIFVFPFLLPLLKALKVNLIPQDAVDFFTRAIKKIKENREKEGQGVREKEGQGRKKAKGSYQGARVDFLQLMLESQRSSVDHQSNGLDQPFKGLTDTEILAQAFIFIFAGYETSSNSLGYTAYLMATHPDVQQKVQAEIDSVLPDKAPLTYDAIMQLEYLDMVLNETQRLYPLVGRLERVCKKDVEVNGVTIRKGTVVVIPPFVLHRDPEYWPEPDEFRPERFSKENRESMDPYTFLPFGAGPRNCIGMRFAMVSMKVATASLLRQFSFRVCKETPFLSPIDLFQLSCYLSFSSHAFSSALEYGVWPYGVFKKLDIPGPTPWPFIGTALGYRKGVLTYDRECFEKYGKIWGLYDGRQPVMVVTDIPIIKAVLVKECYSVFTNRRIFGPTGRLKSAISIAEDDHWKKIRTILSPTFTSGKLKEMFPIINHHVKILLKSVQQRAEGDDVVDIKQLLGAYSMDVITSTSFGVNTDSINNPEDPFVKEARKLTKFDLFSPIFILLYIFPFTSPLMNKMNWTIFPHEAIEFFARSINKIKKQREEGGEKGRVDFLQLMMDSQKHQSNGLNDSQKALTDDEILAQATIFIFAGYEAVSNSLMYLAYELALHPDVQQKLQDEIDTVMSNKAGFTYDTIMQMEYVDMAVSEILRMYPLGGRIERVCKKDVEINGITIPKGTTMVIPPYVLHFDPEHWTDPKEFKPERFSKENKDNINPYVYLPFGAGPRNCIGSRFSLLTMKAALVSILQNFSFRPCKETQIPLVLNTKGLMRPEKPIKLKIVPRARPTQ